MFPIYQNYYDFPAEALPKPDFPRKQQVVQIVPDPVQDENGHFACSWVDQGQLCGCRYANADDLGRHVQIRHISGEFPFSSFILFIKFRLFNIALLTDFKPIFRR